ncbi:chorismate synthase, partial [Candidatus Marinamargulisbacteria bacterium SCGC AAA071-K20]
VFEGKTTGTPIALLVRNKDANSKAYDHLKNVYRPSHADYTFDEKFGHRNWQGGGRSSARETIGRVAAGAIAKKILKKLEKIEILSYVSSIHTLSASVNTNTLTLKKIDANIVRCPDKKVAESMIKEIEAARKEGESLGGVVSCVIKSVPAGLGEPVFDKLKADLAKAMMSIPATMGFQIGAGFSGATLKGSEHNDAFYMDKGMVRTRTNHAGGTLGGISSGENITFDVAFKPTATIFKEQETITTSKKATTLAAKGRHDPCVLPRAVPIVDAMSAIVLVDHYLRNQARKGLFT